MKQNDEFRQFLAERVNINDSRYEELKSHQETLTGILKNHLDGYRTTERHGSFALETIIRPTTDDASVDIDLLVVMEEIHQDHRWYVPAVASAFTSLDRYKDKVTVKNRAVTITYNDQGRCSIDLVPCIVKSDGKHFICPKDEPRMQETDGTGFRNWFNDRNAITKGNLKRVVRLLKWKRDHHTAFNCESIIITALAGKAIRDRDKGQECVQSVADTLVTVLTRISKYLEGQQYPLSIPNPSLPAEKFTSHMSEPDFDNLKEVVSRLMRQATAARDERDPKESLKKWQAILGNGFQSAGSPHGRPGSGAAIPPVVPQTRRGNEARRSG